MNSLYRMETRKTNWSGVGCGGRKRLVEGRNIEIRGQHFGDGVAELHFFALFSHFGGGDVDGVSLGFAGFFGLSAFLRSKANFG
ncbi:MAG TPA: hypothetical protein VF283_01115 [Bryobacteraceae bacterium]